VEKKVKTVLFVCTGNTCRSPMAEALANDYLLKHKSEKEPPRIISAGLSAFPNVPASPQAREVMLELGLDISAHQARLLTAELLEEAALILTMTAEHKKYIEEILTTMKKDSKVYLLKEYALGDEVQNLPASYTEKETNSQDMDILDPFGQSVEVYRACAQELSTYISQALERFRRCFYLKIALGSDHGGFNLKEEIKKWLEEKDYGFTDYGTYSTESCDYPDVALKVARAVAAGECTHGILVCGTGIGVSIVANKVPGIRAALCHDTFSARASREHNNANVLALGERVIGRGLALDIVETWLNASFSGGRHQRRVDIINALDEKKG
jgi:ribose 5-phosphate isomerase B